MQTYNTIRFDLRMAAPFPLDLPRELWLDHAIVHETAGSYRESVLDHLEDGKGLLDKHCLFAEQSNQSAEGMQL